MKVKTEPKSIVSKLDWRLSMSIAAVISISILLGFQNCSSYSVSQMGLSNSGIFFNGTSGNGDGYTGKLNGTYVNLDVDGVCLSEDQEESVVVVKEGKAYLTKENCQDITPREITTNVDIRIHSPEALLFEQRLFERVQENKPREFSEIMCRGSTVDESSGHIADADVFMVNTGEFEEIIPPPMVEPNGTPITLPKYTGRVNTGVYDLDHVLLDYRSASIWRAHKMVTGPTTNYLILPDTSELGAPTPGSVPGDYKYERMPYNLKITYGKGRLLFGSQELEKTLVVENMDCYVH